MESGRGSGRDNAVEQKHIQVSRLQTAQFLQPSKQWSRSNASNLQRPAGWPWRQGVGVAARPLRRAHGGRRGAEHYSHCIAILPMVPGPLSLRIRLASRVHLVSEQETRAVNRNPDGQLPGVYDYTVGRYVERGREINLHRKRGATRFVVQSRPILQQSDLTEFGPYASMPPIHSPARSETKTGSEPTPPIDIYSPAVLRISDRRGSERSSNQGKSSLRKTS